MINSVNGNINYNTYTDYERRQQRARSKAESLTARVSTIANDDKRAVATELKNRILHGDYGREKMIELSDQLRELVVEHGDINPGIRTLVSMRINVGTEDEPIWAAIRGENIFIKKGWDDSIGEDMRVANWSSPWTNLLEDTEGLDEDIISRLLQYQEFLRAVNGNTDEPVSFYLFDNLRDATSFFNDNNIAENENSFRRFVSWLFTARASSPQDIGLANQSAENFLNIFFTQLRENMDSEQAFLMAWSGIQPPQETSGYNVTA